MVFSGTSEKYAACEKCTSGEDGRTIWYRPVEDWNNAYTWKLIDQLEADKREILEALQAFVEDGHIPFEDICDDCGLDWPCEYADAKAVYEKHSPPKETPRGRETTEVKP
jgi:hypothetical protein